jgi:peroxiredoxin
MTDEPKKKSVVRRVRRVVVDLLLLGILVVGLSAWTERGMLPANGEPAPSFVLPTLDGQLVSVEDQQGATLVHFWATWCGVCSKQHAGLNRLAAELPDRTSLLTIVVGSGSHAEIAAYVAEHELDFPVLVDDGTVAEAFGVRSFPSDFYLNASHEVVGRDAGYAPVWAISRRLRSAR